MNKNIAPCSLLDTTQCPTDATINNTYLVSRGTTIATSITETWRLRIGEFRYLTDHGSISSHKIKSPIKHNTLQICTKYPLSHYLHLLSISPDRNHCTNNNCIHRVFYCLMNLNPCFYNYKAN